MQCILIKCGKDSNTSPPFVPEMFFYSRGLGLGRCSTLDIFTESAVVRWGSKCQRPTSSFVWSGRQIAWRVALSKNLCGWGWMQHMPMGRQWRQDHFFCEGNSLEVGAGITKSLRPTSIEQCETLCHSLIRAVNRDDHNGLLQSPIY